MMEDPNLSNEEEDAFPVHVAVGPLDDSGLEPHFPSSKSMDNMESIILENTIDDDEDTSVSVDQLDSILEEESTSDNDNQVVRQVEEFVKDTLSASTPMRKEKPTTEDNIDNTNELSRYFMSEDGGGDFFDSFSQSVTVDDNTDDLFKSVTGDNDGLHFEVQNPESQQQLTGGNKDNAEVVELGMQEIDKFPVEENKEKSKQEKETISEIVLDSLTKNESESLNTDNSQTLNHEDKGLSESQVEKSSLKPVLETERIRTTSCSEEIPVAFEESKGEGLRLAPSTKSLCKFFTEDGGGHDTEGKSFFDTFTAAEGEEEPGDQAPASLPTSEPGTVRTSASETSLPPETPPVIPDTPPIIPGTSPFQSQPPTPLTTPLPTSNQQPPLLTQESRGSLSLETDALNIQVPFDTEEDAFSQSLKMSDENRRYDAWIPSEATRQVLVTIGTNPPGTYIPTPEHLTMPGVVVDESQGDPVKELVKKFRGEQEASQRQTMGLANVPHTESGLQQLIGAECYRAAVDLTGLLLTQCGQGNNSVNTPTKHSPYSLQLWLVRIALLMKLRLYSHAESECQAFGGLDKPDLYYEFYPDIYPGRKGCMVPFKLRLLLAELPLYLGKTQDSLDRLYYLQAIVAKILNNLESGQAEDGSSVHISDSSRKASRELWEAKEVQLLYSIGNCLLNIKDYTTALEIYESLLNKDEDNKAALLCGIGRIYLQMGDIKQAQTSFNKAEKLTKETDNNYIKSRNFMNKGFLALGQNQFKDAQQHFKDAVDMDPENGVAVNNMAVTSLYTGKLKEALTILEDLVHSNPTKYLQEGLLFNLCTLYELESSQALHKKQKLLDLVSLHKGNGFNVACLKMA